MSKILHVIGSPRNQRSHSNAVAEEFLSAFKLKNPSAEIESIDVWSLDLPEFNSSTLDAKYSVLRGENPTDEQEKAWSEIQMLFAQFNNADAYVFSVPMWNFSIPYRLKHYIDIVTQPGMAWSYTPEEGYKGLMKNKKALVISASGDGYGDGTGFEAYDLQKPYMNLWLNFIGITDIHAINVEATLFADRNSESQARQEASKLGYEF